VIWGLIVGYCAIERGMLHAAGSINDQYPLANPQMAITNNKQQMN
jgi:hypothetical protein